MFIITTTFRRSGDKHVAKISDDGFRMYNNSMSLCELTEHNWPWCVQTTLILAQFGKSIFGLPMQALMIRGKLILLVFGISMFLQSLVVFYEQNRDHSKQRCVSRCVYAPTILSEHAV